MDVETLSDFFEESELCDAANFSSAAASPQDDIFCVLEAWESASENNKGTNEIFEFRKSSCSLLGAAFQESEAEHNEAASPKCKRQKLDAATAASEVEEAGQQLRMSSHITVERNRRKQMNEHLSVLRSLMPCFYVKRGDQASIIGGVVDYINELQHLRHSLEARKQRKAYTQTLSPRVVSSPRPCPLSPRLSLPIGPITPQTSSTYKPPMQLHSPSLPSPVQPSPSNSSTSSINELVATSKSAVAEVEVKFLGPNLHLKTVSHRMPGQALKIVSALEELALEILHLKISTVDQTMLSSLTIKIGIDCQLSAEELAQQIQQTFS